MSLLLDALKKAEEAKRQEDIGNPVDASVRPENEDLDLELALEEIDVGKTTTKTSVSENDPGEQDLDRFELTDSEAVDSGDSVVDPVVDLSIQPEPAEKTHGHPDAGGFPGDNPVYPAPGTPFGADLNNYQTYNRGRILTIAIVTTVVCVLAWWHFSRSLNKLNKPTVGTVPPISARKVPVKPVTSQPGAGQSTAANARKNAGIKPGSGTGAGSSVKEKPGVTAGDNTLSAKNTTVSSDTSQSGIIKPSDGVYILGVNTGNASKKPARAIRIERSYNTPETETLVRSAYSAYQSGNLKQAEKLYLRVLSTDDANRDAYLGLAAIAVHRKKFSDAKLLYKKLLELNPKDSVALTGYLAVHQSKEATDIRTISDLKFLLKQEPDAAHLHFELGNAYVRHRRWPEAQNAYFQAYNLDRDNADYAFNLAVSLDHIGERGTAIRFYIKALRISGKRNVSFSRQQIKRRLKQLTGRDYQ